MSAAGIPVCCLSCGAQACVNRVTANLRCGCGSSEVDLVDGTAAQRQHLAMLRTARMSFLDFMREGASSPVGDEIKGWNVYKGPAPGANPWGHRPPANVRCPVCHGSGLSIQDGGTCRECGGDGKMTPTTAVEPEPLVAKHPGQSTQTTVPFMGRRTTAGLPTPEEVLRETTGDYGSQGQRGPEKSDPFGWDNTSTHYPRADNLSPATRHRQERDYSRPPKGPFEMPGAACPNCGTDPTHLVKDHKQNAWWNCPNCGPLTNIDKDYDVDPYNPPEGFRPSGKGFKSAKTASYHGQDRGVVLRLVATIQGQNPGLKPPEIVSIARATVSRYLEKP